MVKVYVVCEVIEYEGFKMLHAYSIREVARRIAKELNSKVTEPWIHYVVKEVKVD